MADHPYRREDGRMSVRWNRGLLRFLFRPFHRTLITSFPSGREWHDTGDLAGTAFAANLTVCFFTRSLCRAPQKTEIRVEDLLTVRSPFELFNAPCHRFRSRFQVTVHLLCITIVDHTCSLKSHTQASTRYYEGESWALRPPVPGMRLSGVVRGRKSILN
jgi:hypothetical protein